MFLDVLAARTTERESPRQRHLLFERPASGIIIPDEDKALTYSAVWAAVSMIANTLAVVNWKVMERSDRGQFRLFDDPIARLLNTAPNQDMTPSTFRRVMALFALLWGNGYAEIDRPAPNQAPNNLWPIHPARVKPQYNDAGALVYEINNGTEKPPIIPARNMFNVVGMSNDGITGYSPIRVARESMAMGLAMENFGASFFGNDARPGFVLQAPEKLSEKAEENIREWLEKNHGGPNRKWRPGILEQGIELKEIGIPPEDAQYIESRKFQVTEVARWFNIPPHKIRDLSNATFSNIDSQERMFVTEAVLPWARAFEEEANRRLVPLSRRGRVHTKFDFTPLIRGDVKTRGEFYNTLFQVGAFSPNDIRMKEDMNPVPGGDVRMVPGNMTTLGQAGTQMGPSSYYDIFRDAAARMQRKEHRAATQAHERKETAKRLAAFYESHRQHMVEAFQPAAVSLAKTTGFDAGPMIEALQSWAREYCTTAFDTLIEADDATIQEWTGSADNMASRVIEVLTEVADSTDTYDREKDNDRE